MKKRSVQTSTLKHNIKVCYFLLFFLFTASGLWAQDALVLPRPAQLAWQKAGFGVVFHYDLHVFDTSKYQQPINRIQPIKDYNIFNPTQLNTDQWIAAAKDAGAKFAILTVTHETGFALYPSDVNPYCLKAVKWRDGKGDIVKDFVASCKKYGLKPGLYIGIRWNSFLGIHDFKAMESDAETAAYRQQYYKEMAEGMVKELCTRYGDLFEIWFDGGASDPKTGAPDVLPIVEKYQPNTLFYWSAQRTDARWGGTESGTVDYPSWATFPFKSTLAADFPSINDQNNFLLKHGDNQGKYWMPAMSDAPLRGYNGRHEWFWEPNDESHIEPLSSLVNMYYKSVGRNSTLILGLTPDTSGLLPAPDVARLKEFGAEIKKRFENPIITKTGTGNIINISLAKAQKINQMVLQEDIAKGERIQKYRLMGKENGKWMLLCEGSSVGNMRIQTFETMTLKDLKLEITQAKATPIISGLQLFNIEKP